MCAWMDRCIYGGMMRGGGGGGMHKNCKYL